jgi:hypothetical protein
VCEIFKISTRKNQTLRPCLFSHNFIPRGLGDEKGFIIHPIPSNTLAKKTLLWSRLLILEKIRGFLGISLGIPSKRFLVNEGDFLIG